ncbi:MAG TPA: hypothetical protein VL588_02845 [Bdellovibrionota bacterium]|nr:hypothetical protein [Bdellovibrionota bacterium]
MKLTDLPPLLLISLVFGSSANAGGVPKPRMSEVAFDGALGTGGFLAGRLGFGLGIDPQWRVVGSGAAARDPIGGTLDTDLRAGADAWFGDEFSLAFGLLSRGLGDTVRSFGAEFAGTQQVQRLWSGTRVTEVTARFSIESFHRQRDAFGQILSHGEAVRGTAIGVGLSREILDSLWISGAFDQVIYDNPSVMEALGTDRFFLAVPGDLSGFLPARTWSAEALWSPVESWELKVRYGATEPPEGHGDFLGTWTAAIRRSPSPSWSVGIEGSVAASAGARETAAAYLSGRLSW